MCIICNNNINDLILLKKIKIENCNKIKKIPKELINLKKIKIIKCYNFEIIPKELINLEKLYVHYFNKIHKLPLELINMNKLQLDYHYFNNQSAMYFYSNDYNEIKKILKFLNNI
jgi:hypothetical protein